MGIKTKTIAYGVAAVCVGSLIYAAFLFHVEAVPFLPLTSPVNTARTERFNNEPVIDKALQRIIDQGLDEGATLVECRQHVCHIVQTGEVLDGEDQDGFYLIYLDTTVNREKSKEIGNQVKKITG